MQMYDNSEGFALNSAWPGTLPETNSSPLKNGEMVLGRL